MTDKRKQCFVVSPIGKQDSDARIHADWLLEGIIKPVFEADYPEFDIVRADTISAPGLIDTQIIEPLLDAELVIADITTLNPNVFYEIGIRHVMQKPIVHMHLEGENIPFDISIFRSIPFSRTSFHDIEKAKADLRKALAAVFLEGYKVDNPVTRTRARFEFEKSATPQDMVILNEIESLKSRVAKFEKFKAVPINQVLRAPSIVEKKEITVIIEGLSTAVDTASTFVDREIVPRFTKLDVIESMSGKIYIDAPNLKVATQVVQIVGEKGDGQYSATVEER